MSLPGTTWLKRQLSSVDDLSGGYQRKMGSPVVSGAGFAASVVPVVAWALMLVPLLLVALARSLARRVRSRACAKADLRARPAEAAE